jgi:hypothetical protein
MQVEITENGEVEINGTLIKDEIFREEKVDYRLSEREQIINDLIDWISESKSESDKTLMKEDLKCLMRLNDEYVFSSVSTNEYVAESDYGKRFNEICSDILELNDVLSLNLTATQKEALVYLYNKRKPVSAILVLHQAQFKKSSAESRTYESLKKKGLVEWVGTGLRNAVAYPTKKGMRAIEELKLVKAGVV